MTTTNSDYSPTKTATTGDGCAYIYRQPKLTRCNRTNEQHDRVRGLGHQFVDVNAQPPEHGAGLRDQTVLCEDHNKPICDECGYCVEDPEHQKHVAQSDTGQPRRDAGDLPVIASHTALLDVLDAAKALIAMNNCNYDRAAMRSEGGFQKLEEAVGRVEALRRGRDGE